MTSRLFNALLLFLLFAAASLGRGGAVQTTPSLEFHHRFSAPVRRWLEARGYALPGGWPAPGGAAYVAALAEHDRHHAMLAASAGGSGEAPPLTFAEGNATLKFALCSRDRRHTRANVHGGSGHWERPLLAAVPV